MVGWGDTRTVGDQRHADSAVVAVLAALYPAVTVLLARSTLCERVSRVQLVGPLLAAVAVVAIAGD